MTHFRNWLQPSTVECTRTKFECSDIIISELTPRFWTTKQHDNKHTKIGFSQIFYFKNGLKTLRSGIRHPFRATLVTILNFWQADWFSTHGINPISCSLSKYGSCQSYHGKFSLKMTENSGRKEMKFEIFSFNVSRLLDTSLWKPTRCSVLCPLTAHIQRAFLELFVKCCTAVSYFYCPDSVRMSDIWSGSQKTKGEDGDSVMPAC